MLEELGVSYELRMLEFPPRARARHFLEENPLGTVPYFTDGDVRMTESAAICQYLATRFPGAGLSVDAEDESYGAYLNWLHMSDATLTFPQTLVLRYRHFEPQERRQPEVASDYAKWFLARLRAVDLALEHEAFLCAGRFTAADVAVGYALLLAEHLGLHTSFSSRVQSYWDLLQQRRGYQRAHEVQFESARQQNVSLVAAPDLRPFATGASSN
jgi:glutathione S-transferase